MKIVIAGCGKIGTTVVASLVSEGHDVVVIDKKESVVSEITDIYDVMGVIGSCTDCDVLSEAGIEKAELFSSFTDSDELNMLSCFLAKKMGAKHTIARIRNPEYNDKSLGFMRQQLDLSMAINPERLAARELFNILKLPSSVKIETFSRSNLELIEIKLKDDSVISGKKLTEIRDKYKAKFLVCTVQRGGDIYIPDGNFVLRGGDKIGITASPQEIQKLFKALGMTQRSAKSVMILGGSRTAYYLAKILTATGNSVKIIEQDKRLCDDICTWIPKAVVINGDGAQQELLIEEGIRSVDAFVALTGLDEENILISIFALSQKVPKVISKINRDELESMAGKLGLDCVYFSQKNCRRYSRRICQGS